MAQKTKQKFNKDLWEKHKKFQDTQFYGITTMGERGQVVIPADARKELDLQPGEKLIVLGKFGKILAVMKANNLNEIMNEIMKRMEGSGVEKEIKSQMEKLFSGFNKN